MPELSGQISFECWCECGEGLCARVEVVPEGKKVWEDGYSTGPAIIVEPCPVCCKKKTKKKKRAQT